MILRKLYSISAHVCIQHYVVNEDSGGLGSDSGYFPGVFSHHVSCIEDGETGPCKMALVLPLRAPTTISTFRAPIVQVETH